jgi:hypothetical protein
MHTYRLVDDFVDAGAEQALLASLVNISTLYWDLLDLLTPDIFPTLADTWQALVLALETGQSPSIPADWLPAPDPHATVRRLVDLGRVPIFPVRLLAKPGVKWPYVSRGSTAPPYSTSARARWPRHWHDTRTRWALSSAS